MFPRQSTWIKINLHPKLSVVFALYITRQSPGSIGILRNFIVLVTLKKAERKLLQPYIILPILPLNICKGVTCGHQSHAWKFTLQLIMTIDNRCTVKTEMLSWPNGCCFSWMLDTKMLLSVKCVVYSPLHLCFCGNRWVLFPYTDRKL